MLPGMLMLLMSLRGWHGLATWSGAARSLAGVAAAVTGLLAAAWIDPIATTLDWRGAVTIPCVLIIVMSARLRVPIPIAIVTCAGWGWLLSP
jgi:chromate transporter